MYFEAFQTSTGRAFKHVRSHNVTGPPPMSHGTAPVNQRERIGEVTGAVPLDVLPNADEQAAAAVYFYNMVIYHKN